MLGCCEFRFWLVLSIPSPFAVENESILNSMPDKLSFTQKEEKVNGLVELVRQIFTKPDLFGGCAAFIIIAP